MKDIKNYISENISGLNEDLMSKAQYLADKICLAYAFIEIYKEMLRGNDEHTIDIMYELSGDVSEFNSLIPKSISRYGQSTTNITCDDWISTVKFLMYKNQSEKDVKDLIVKDDKKDYAYFGTSFSKDALKRILELYKENFDKSGLKKLIADTKKEITDAKREFTEYKKSLKN